MLGRERRWKGSERKRREAVNEGEEMKGINSRS